MRAIRKLPDSVTNKIAAGEVIERPSSAVKELLENSIDAGARSITVEVREGGRDFIRIVDDGCGIPQEQLPLAVESHATSKLADAEELFRVRTLGFRGEALASIASVSDFRLQSRPADQAVGAALEVHHGTLGPILECGCPPGTQIEVSNLFASVPVRRKFLKSKQTELGHISDACTRIALAYPGLALRLAHNDRVIQERPGDLNREQTIARLFGAEIAEALIAVDSQNDGLRITGFVANPRIQRPNNRAQYLFVNGRFLRDRSLGHAISEAYRGLIMTGRYPVTFLFIEMPVDQLDVNVHPAKIEVRFRDPRQLYSLVLSAIRTRFLASDLTARLQVPVGAPARNADGAALDESDPVVTQEPARREAINRQFTLSSERPGAHQPSLLPDDRRVWPTEESPVPSADTSAPDTSMATPAGVPAAATGVPEEPTAPCSPSAGQGLAPSTSPVPDASQVVDDQGTAPRFLQLHNAFLVVETEDGMLLIDQHALHERILYEQLRQRVARQSVESQELLVPEPIELDTRQVAILLEQREVLARLGIRLEDFGERCVLLQSYPVMLQRLKPETLIHELVHQLEETGQVPSRDELLEELLHLVACKAAVKAGDRLASEEIEELLRMRHLVDDSHHCPHGRPTMLRFTLRDLERQFRRT